VVDAGIGVRPIRRAAQNRDQQLSSAPRLRGRGRHRRPPVDEQAARDPKETLSLMLFAMKKRLSIYTKVDDSNRSIGDIGHRVGQRVGQRILAHARTFAVPAPAMANDDGPERAYGSRYCAGLALR
jgi:hypothetical protein